MRFTFLIASLVLFLDSFALAAPATIFGPTKFSASPSGSLANASFASSLDGANGVLTVINGSGQDLTPLTCPQKPITQFITCQLENVTRKLQTYLDRPSQIEISLNNKVLVTSSSLPPQLGKIQIAIQAKLLNQLQVRLKGLQSSSVTIDVKAETQQPNQNPIARISLTPQSGIAPELVSLSALASSDPDDDLLTDYAWEFGDGVVATGSLVTHTFTSAGAYSIRLTVTDSRGGRGSVVQTIMIVANQPPLAEFTSATETGLGIMKALFDARASRDPDGSSLENIQWDFGDGSTLSGAPSDLFQVEHIYANPGDYQVQLTITDFKGGVGSQTRTITVQDLTPPLLTIKDPVNGATLDSKGVVVRGVANEKLSQASALILGGSPVSLQIGSDGKSFSGTLLSVPSGAQTLQITARDVAGLPTTLNLSITVNSSDFWTYSECSAQSEEP